MDIKTTLEQKYSKEGMLSIRDYIGTNTVRFDELMQLFFSGEYRTTQRASWALLHCADAHPELIEPYLEQMLQNLRKDGLHDSIKRNSMRIMEQLTLSDELLGEAADIAFQYLAEPNEAVAVRVFSMGLIWNICQKEPDLRHELRLLIEEYMPYGSAGFKSRGKKILAAMNKQFED